MFNQDIVAFVQFSPKPSPAFLDIMRKHGNYRKEPFPNAGPGWYVSRDNIKPLHADSKDICPALSRRLAEVYNKIAKNPGAISCPSREKDVPQKGKASRKKAPMTVTKVGSSKVQ